MGLRSYFGGIVKVVTLYASGVLYHAKGVVSYGAGNGTTVGNARGTGANDLQTSRNAATKVASGAYSTIGGGLDNTASGLRSTVSAGYNNQATGSSASVGGGESNVATQSYARVGGGYLNTASQTYTTVGGGGSNVASNSYATVAGGSTGTASGNSSTVGGGAGNQATAGMACIPGGYQAKADHYGEIAHAAGRFAATGDAQVSRVIWRGTTTDAVQTELFLDGSSVRYTIDDDSTYLGIVYFVARRTDADDESGGYIRQICVDRNAGVTAQYGANTVIGADREDNAAWTVTVEADDTNDAIVVKVTGEAAKTIRWVVFGEIVKVSG